MKICHQLQFNNLNPRRHRTNISILYWRLSAECKYRKKLSLVPNKTKPSNNIVKTWYIVVTHLQHLSANIWLRHEYKHEHMHSHKQKHAYTQTWTHTLMSDSSHLWELEGACSATPCVFLTLASLCAILISLDRSVHSTLWLFNLFVGVRAFMVSLYFCRSSWWVCARVVFSGERVLRVGWVSTWKREQVSSLGRTRRGLPNLCSGVRLPSLLDAARPALCCSVVFRRVLSRKRLFVLRSGHLALKRNMRARIRETERGEKIQSKTGPSRRSEEYASLVQPDHGNSLWGPGGKRIIISPGVKSVLLSTVGGWAQGTISLQEKMVCGLLWLY